MFCPSCGTAIPTRAAFCIECGSSVPPLVPAIPMVMAVAPPKTLMQIADEAAKFLGKMGGHRRLGLLTLIVILFLMLVGKFFAVMMTFGQ
jgi:zinc-ribbon domain